jgi:tetratricopeptide (TPR) repeat protein
MQKQNLADAIQLHQYGQFSQAYQGYLACLDAVLKEQPKENAIAAEINYLLALLTHDCQCHHLAHYYFEQACSLMPDSPRFLESKALTLNSLARIEDAISTLEASLRFDPEQIEASLNLARFYKLNHQVFRALRMLHRLLAKYANLGPIHYYLAEIYFEAEAFDSAFKYANNSLSLDPANREAIFLLGRTLVRINLHEEAVNLLSQLAESPEATGENLKELGVLLFCHNNLAVATQLLAVAKNTLPYDGQIPIYLRAALGKEKDPLSFLHLASKSHLAPSTVSSSVPFSSKLPSPPWEVILVSPINFSLYGGGQNSTQVARCLYQSGHRFLFTQASSDADFADTFHLWENLFLFQDFPMTSAQRQEAELMFKTFSSPTLPDKLLVFGIYSRYLVDLAEIAKAHGYRTVYWCYDNWHAMKWPFKRSDSERLLAQSVDGVITTSDVLRQKMLNRYQRDAVVIRNGFSPEQFPLDLSIQPECPADLVKTGEKTLLYWGHLASDWIDWELLESVVLDNPQWTFNLIGKVNVTEKTRFSYPNVHFLGEKNVEELYAYGRHADLGFIHFKDIAVIRAVNPVKAYEYLASGLPVVSTPMTELDHFPGVIQVRTANAFSQAAKILMNNPPNREDVVNFLSQQSWQARADALITLAQSLT